MFAQEFIYLFYLNYILTMHTCLCNNSDKMSSNIAISQPYNHRYTSTTYWSGYPSDHSPRATAFNCCWPTITNVHDRIFEGTRNADIHSYPWEARSPPAFSLQSRRPRVLGVREYIDRAGKKIRYIKSLSYENVSGVGQTLTTPTIGGDKKMAVRVQHQGMRKSR
jgi:hypothetical protein